MQRLVSVSSVLRTRLLRLLPFPTLGVKAIVLSDSKVLLVKHTYTENWSFPGGGVRWQERPDEALSRELREEVHLAVSSRQMELAGCFTSKQEGRIDHVFLFVVTLPGLPQIAASRAEIADWQWAEIADLPHDCAPSVRRRLADMTAGREVGDW